MLQMCPKGHLKNSEREDWWISEIILGDHVQGLGLFDISNKQNRKQAGLKIKILLRKGKGQTGSGMRPLEKQNRPKGLERMLNMPDEMV